MSSTNRGTVRSDRDLYQTPFWVVNELVKRLEKTNTHLMDVGLPPFHNLIDAGSGLDGRIGFKVSEKLRTLRYAYLVDLYNEDDRKDMVEGVSIEFRKRDYCGWLSSDWPKDDSLRDINFLIVSNPPFSQSEDFVMRSVEWIKTHGHPASVAVFLLRLNWLASRRRADWLNANPPARISSLAPRPSFCKNVKIVDGKKKTSSNDSCEYAWVWWGSRLIHQGWPFFDVATRSD